jgi:hypothetical protein
MTRYLLAAVTVLAAFGMTAIGDMVSQEVRDRLDHVPQAILRLAARRLDPDQGSALYEEVWLPDLAYFLRGDKARPVTRLVHGTRYALGIVVAARRIARHLDRAEPAVGSAQEAIQHLVPWTIWDVKALLMELDSLIHGQEVIDWKPRALAMVDREIVRVRVSHEAVTDELERAEAKRLAYRVMSMRHSRRERLLSREQALTIGMDVLLGLRAEVMTRWGESEDIAE